MKFNDLQTSPHKDKTRVGRGIAAGRGKTAGRGTKGQNARTGSKHYATFMGGQGPLMRRVPKLHGFKSLRVPAQVVYTDQLAELANKTADNQTLTEAGLVATPYHSVKVILRGELKAKVAVRIQAASKAAQEMIAKAGGSFEKVEVPHYPKSTRKAAQKAEEKEQADKAEKTKE